MNFLRILVIIGLLWLLFGSTSNAQTVDVYSQTLNCAGDTSPGVGTNGLLFTPQSRSHHPVHGSVPH